VAEVLFYHLERTPLSQVLPGLLEKSLERGWQAAVVTGDDEQLASIDTHLWTYRDESFLPHATEAGSDDPAAEPVLLQTMAQFSAGPQANAPQILFLINDARPALDRLSGYTRCVTIFDGLDHTAVENHRGYWKAFAEAKDVFTPTYWRQNGQGKWEKKA